MVLASFVGSPVKERNIGGKGGPLGHYCEIFSKTTISVHRDCQSMVALLAVAVQANG